VHRYFHAAQDGIRLRGFHDDDMYFQCVRCCFSILKIPHVSRRCRQRDFVLGAESTQHYSGQLLPASRLRGIPSMIQLTFDFQTFRWIGFPSMRVSKRRTNDLHVAKWRSTPIEMRFVPMRRSPTTIILQDRTAVRAADDVVNVDQAVTLE
jgi:hypothetical protein